VVARSADSLRLDFESPDFEAYPTTRKNESGPVFLARLFLIILS